MTMTGYSNRAGLSVAEPLARFIEEQVLPGTGIEPQPFWYGVAGIFGRFAPENEALLIKRDRLQQQIDAWHEQHHGQTIDGETYQAFLREIGYLVAEPAPFSVDPRHVDEEVALRSGPQLVVPALNARFALNAANARWGSLYDALYGTDAIPGTPTGLQERGLRCRARRRGYRLCQGLPRQGRAAGAWLMGAVEGRRAAAGQSGAMGGAGCQAHSALQPRAAYRDRDRSHPSYRQGGPGAYR
jgi:malate synthase